MILKTVKDMRSEMLPSRTLSPVAYHLLCAGPVEKVPVSHYGHGDSYDSYRPVENRWLSKPSSWDLAPGANFGSRGQLARYNIPPVTSRASWGDLRIP